MISRVTESDRPPAWSAPSLILLRNLLAVVRGLSPLADGRVATLVDAIPAAGNLGLLLAEWRVTSKPAEWTSQKQESRRVALCGMIERNAGDARLEHRRWLVFGSGGP